MRWGGAPPLLGGEANWTASKGEAKNFGCIANGYTFWMHHLGGGAILILKVSENIFVAPSSN